MSSKNWKTYLPYFIATIGVIAFVIFITNNAERYQQLFQLSAISLVWWLILILLFAFIRGYINYLFYRGLELRITVTEGFGLAVLNTLANQLPFFGGMIAKGIYLKQRHSLPYSLFVVTTLALFMCFFATNGIIGLIILIYLDLLGDIEIPTVLYFGFASMACSLLLFWLPISTNKLPARWGIKLKQLVQGWKVLSRNPKLLVQLISLNMLGVFINAGRLWIAFHALSQEVTLLACTLFSSATILTQLFSISPGGLGVREVIVAGLASMMDIDLDISIVAVSLDRFIALFLMIVVGVLLAIHMKNKSMFTIPKENDDLILHNKIRMDE